MKGGEPEQSTFPIKEAVGVVLMLVAVVIGSGLLIWVTR